ncbi:MAG: hypothetical protein BWY99_02889 [Synergistetes bacterium ADurb.BinA166]|nr:MAG: hypothetical protein BWY99_02889 [Synergistetes bacterium ADurb.BinA166]
MVVGTRSAACFPPWTARKAARSATSVFPYPTSPTSSLSMGKRRSISSRISEMATSWSFVSAWGKERSNWSKRSSRGGNANPSTSSRFAYSSSSARTSCRTRSFVLATLFFHLVPRSESSCTSSSACSESGVILWSCSTGRKRRLLSANSSTRLSMTSPEIATSSDPLKTQRPYSSWMRRRPSTSCSLHSRGGAKTVPAEATLSEIPESSRSEMWTIRLRGSTKPLESAPSMTERSSS